MSEAAVARLIDGAASLSHALDAGGADAIETANRHLSVAVAEIAACGAWRARPDLKARLLHARALLDAGRARVNFLADHATRRLDRLAALTGAPPTPAYGRHGRRR